MMGGEIDWAGLPIVCELLGVTDVAKLVRQMTVIRETQRELTANA